MAKNSVRDFDATAANNTDIQSVDIAENCAPSGINNAIRELMADIKDVSTGTVALESPQADSLTVTGDLTVDTNTLYVDSTNNNVGIGTSSPDTSLHLSTSSPVIKLQRSGFTPYAQIASNNTGDLWLYADEGNVGSNTSMAFRVDGSERMRIDSSGNVNIGTTSGFGELNVKNSIQLYNDNVDGASHTDATIGEISSQVRNYGGSISTARFSSIKFCVDPSTYYYGDIRFFTNNSDGTASAGTERMRILSGGGITFNGDTATANALDDYEEGTWTPTYAGTTTNPTITYHSQTRGNYTKIGNLVIANVEVITDSVSGGSGILAISGLPFTASSLNRCGTGSIGFANNFATSNHPAGMLVVANSTDVFLYKRSSTDAQAPLNTALTTASLASGGVSNQIIGTLVYRTD